jgi:hypothetical protein
MLRASARAFGYPLDEAGLTDASVDPGVPGGRALLRFVDALFDGPAVAERKALITAIGPEAMHDAATVFGNFQMMNRVAEASGIPVAASTLAREAETITRLGLDRFRGHRG